MTGEVGGEAKEIEELKKVLDKVSKALINTHFLSMGAIYLGWTIWLVFILVFRVLYEALNMPMGLFYTVFFITFVAAIVANNILLPNAVRSIAGLAGRNYVGVNRRRMSLLMLAFWLAGVAMYVIVSATSVASTLSADLAYLVALMLLLGTGNLGVYVALWKYVGIVQLWSYVLVLGFYLAPIPLCLAKLPADALWVVGIGIIAILYSLLSLLNILSALR